jgi:hypothetical protein
MLPKEVPHEITLSRLPQRVDEKGWLAREMAGFDPNLSPAWRFLTEQHGDRIRKEEIVSLGQVCSARLDIPLVREYKRRKETMLKWFDNHWDIIHPFLVTKVEIILDPETLAKYRAP